MKDIKGLKKLGLVALTLIGLSTFQANAQEMSADKESDELYKKGTFNFGAKMGPTFSYFRDNMVIIDTENDDKAKTKKGLSIGGYFQYNLQTWVSLRGELWFMQTGAANLYNAYVGKDLLVSTGRAGAYVNSSYSGIDIYNYASDGTQNVGRNGISDAVELYRSLHNNTRDGVNRDVDTPNKIGGEANNERTTSHITLNQVDIPLMVVIRPPMPTKFLKNLYPSFYAGYALAITLDARDERLQVFDLQGYNGYSELGFTQSTRRDITSDFRRTDQAAVFGFGFTYPLKDKKWRLVFDARYRLGMSHVNKNTRLSSSEYQFGGTGRRYYNDLTTNTGILSFGIEF
ncbi:MAG: hypothetical protein OHK0038_10950 [Flammeovirgaceae bacterium]